MNSSLRPARTTRPVDVDNAGKCVPTRVKIPTMRRGVEEAMVSVSAPSSTEKAIDSSVLCPSSSTMG